MAAGMAMWGFQRQPPGTSGTGGSRGGGRVGGNVPDKAWGTLGQIDQGKWPGSAGSPGTKGGGKWKNDPPQLPTKELDGTPITYREWDVNPKVQGKPRDSERIVTGSDGSAWYTGDHYATFERMR
ncbi:ribonuclease [Nocardia otitidiscaviarum]|nr:ribonuclease [Nocardia otitidiscaviarum]